MNSDLLKKYLDGQCTPEEEKEVLEYLEEGKEDRLHNHIIALEAAAGDKIPDELSEELLDNIHNRINVLQRRTLLVQMKKWQVAAGIILLISVAGMVFWSLKQKKQVQGEDEWLSIRNEGQDVKKISMPDGTQIWLNARATLSYNEKSYNDKVREVKVNGEVFFEVEGDPRKPFSVKTGNVTTVVLGTAFNIEHYEHESDIRVTLVQGKVEVAADKEKYILSPGQMMSYNVEQRSMEVRSMDVDATRDWLTGRMVFNDLPLADVLKRIAETYKISIVCQQPAILVGKRLTGTYMRKAPEELLRKILFVHGLHLEKRPGQFVIKP